LLECWRVLCEEEWNNIESAQEVCGIRSIEGEKVMKYIPSPANPALHIPDPLSITNACTSSPSIVLVETQRPDRGT
jgi:hypothetical protein